MIGTAEGSSITVAGGAGWRVRAVSDDGTPLDARLGAVLPSGLPFGLVADVSFDIWSFGAGEPR